MGPRTLHNNSRRLLGRRLYHGASSAHGSSSCCQSLDSRADAKRRSTHIHALGDANAASIVFSNATDTNRPIPDAVGWF